MLLGVAWVLIGVGALDWNMTGAASPHGPLLHDMLPLGFRSTLWVTGGVVAAVYAWRPPGFDDAAAWALLYVPPAIRLVSYSVAWIDSALPFGGAGWSQGWAPAAIYMAMVGVVYTCADWPEPPRPLEAMNPAREE